MKIILQILPIAFVCIACQSSNYYTAQKVNEKRFNGWQQENADYLTRANDLILTLESLYELGMSRTNSKNVYLVANEADKNLEMLLLEIKFHSTTRRVKLSGAMSPVNDELYHQILQTKDENFEFLWNEAIKTKTGELKATSEAYISLGHDDNLKEFANSIVYKIEPFQEKLGYVQAN